MIIQVIREAVCLADDQLEPLELALELGSEATLEDLANQLVRTGFLHFSSTHHTLVGRSKEAPLLRISCRWGSQAVEYLWPANTPLIDSVVAGAVIDFRFERASTLRPAREDLEQRRPVWLALSDLFLDTDVNLFRESNTRTLAASTYSLDQLDTILREEIYPACSYNLLSVAGEWAGFPLDWLEKRILRDGPPPRSWLRRLGRYLALGWSVPVRLPEEWKEWRKDVARLRRADPAASNPDPAG